jgi:hypothetical protein
VGRGPSSRKASPPRSSNRASLPGLEIQGYQRRGPSCLMASDLGRVGRPEAGPEVQRLSCFVGTWKGEGGICTRVSPVMCSMTRTVEPSRSPTPRPPHPTETPAEEVWEPEERLSTAARHDPS